MDKVGADHPISDGLIAVNRLKQMDALASSPEFIKAYQSDAKVRKDFKNQVESLASIVQQSGRAKEGFMFDKEVPLTNISKLGGIRTGEVGLIPVYPEFELMGLGIGKATKTVAVKLLENKSLKVGGREFSQPLGQRVMSTVDGEMAGGNKPIKPPSNVNFQLLERALQHSIPTKGHPNQLMYTLDDGTRLIFRKDFGDKAHPIGNIFQGKGAIDHYNIEVQIPRANGSVRTIENLHIVPNSSGGFTWWGKDGVTKK